MRIIGRIAEKRELERCERSGKSELVCVYGRRRVGKTYLVEQTFAQCFAFRATGVEGGNTRRQLKSFNQRLQECGAVVSGAVVNKQHLQVLVCLLLQREHTLLYITLTIVNCCYYTYLIHDIIVNA